MLRDRALIRASMSHRSPLPRSWPRPADRCSCIGKMPRSRRANSNLLVCPSRDIDRVLGRPNQRSVREIDTRRADILAVLGIGAGIAQIEGQALCRLQRDVRFAALDLAAGSIRNKRQRVAAA